MEILCFFVIFAMVAYCIVEYGRNAIDKKYKKFVINNSKALKILEETNKKYSFYLPTINNKLEHVYDNEIY